MSQKIRIKLKSFDYNLVDKSSEKIVKAVKITGAIVSGPIPLPTRKEIFTDIRQILADAKVTDFADFFRFLHIFFLITAEIPE